MTLTDYKEFRERVIQAGVAPELAQLMYDVVRDCDQHGWMPTLQEWTADREKLIALALEQPQQMSEACELLFATDGLTFDEGQLYAEITDKKRCEIEGWIFGREVDYHEVEEDEEEELTVYGDEPVFEPEKVALAISILRIYTKYDTSSGEICRQFLKACEMKTEIDFNDFSFLDTETMFAAMLVLQGILFHPEETFPLLGLPVRSPEVVSYLPYED